MSLSGVSAAEAHSRRGAQESKRIPELDGLRGIAILSVLAFHYVATRMGPPHGLLKHALWKVMLGGWCGVDLFFVLSGFLIGGILLAQQDAPAYFRPFYGRRIFRILPIYVAWLAFCFLAPAVRKEAFPIHYYLLFIQNIAAGISGSWGGITMAPAWSLAVEEQFYLAIPLLIRFFRGATLTFAIAAACAATALSRTFLLPGSPIAQHTLFRWDSLGAGCLVAIAIRSASARQWSLRHPLILFSVTAVAGCFTAYATVIEGLYLGGARLTGIAVFFALVIWVLTVHRPAWLGASLRWAPLRYAGTISYALYLFHQGVFELWDGRMGKAATIAAALLTGFALASLSWRYFEKPLLQFGHRRFRYSGV